MPDHRPSGGGALRGHLHRFATKTCENCGLVQIAESPELLDDIGIEWLRFQLVAIEL